MPIHKLTNVDAFVAFDLDDAPAAGIVRSAPKILQGGAQELARTLTYAFATLGMQRGGASAGINAQPQDRDDAATAFVEELTPMVAEGRLALDAGKGVDAAQIAPLAEADDRHDIAGAGVGEDDLATHLAGLGPVVAAANVLNGLDGRTVVIEGFGASGPALASAAEAVGAKVVGLSTAKGTLAGDDLSAERLRALWADQGDAMVGDDADAAWKVFTTEADVLFAGSKMGAINHETAARLDVRTVVPHGPIPFTARALAVMGRSDIVAVPDFVSTAAPLLAHWPSGDATVDAVIETAVAAIDAAIDESRDHPDGLFLGACHRAEQFLGTWRSELPFGRPLAS